MERAIIVAACAVASIVLSGCAGLAADPVALAQAARILNEGCQRIVDLNLDKRQPGGGSLRVSKTCAPAPEAPLTADPGKP